MKCPVCKKKMRHNADLVTNIPFGDTYREQYDGREYQCKCGYILHVPWYLEHESEKDGAGK